MAYVKDLQSRPDPQTFPGAQFEVSGQPPTSQCSEAHIEGTNAHTHTVPTNHLGDPGAFLDHALTGKKVTITASVGGNTGLFDITANDPDEIVLTQNPGVGDPVAYYVHDGGELIDTRDPASFAAFIHAAGYAYTFKGGKLYTNIPNSQLQHACTILWNPLT